MELQIGFSQKLSLTKDNFISRYAYRIQSITLFNANSDWRIPTLFEE